jgi:hypothetical protein
MIARVLQTKFLKNVLLGFMLLELLNAITLRKKNWFCKFKARLKYEPAGLF